MMGKCTALAALAVIVGSASAHASVVISTAATQNMNCTGGVCSPTASDAVLNVSKLKHLLAVGDVEVTTTGNGVQAVDLAVAAPFYWSSSAWLTLDAYHSLSFSAAASVKGSGSVSLLTNDGGSGGVLSFGQTGSLSFAQLSSALSINGSAFQLVSSISMLASAVAANSSGLYALAANYKSVTRYTGAPISTPLTGAFEGLGNTIAGLRIAKGLFAGLFAQIGQYGQNVGTVSDLRLTSATVKGAPAGILAGANFGMLSGDSASGNVHVAAGCCGGGLVGFNGSGGTIANSWTSGSISACNRKNVGGDAGGIAGDNEANITNSYSTANISGCAGALLGGLVGDHVGTIEESFATGTVSGTDNNGLSAGSDGGLVGDASAGQITDCYAFGPVSGGTNSDVGGLVGYYGGSGLTSSYSTGFVTAGSNSRLGGFIGFAFEGSNIASDYWDTDTSGTFNGVNGGNTNGVTGLTTGQLQSGLPNGFDPKVWAETSNINGGLPY